MLTDKQDALGHFFYDYFTKKAGQDIIERDDGLIDTDMGEVYFGEYKSWTQSERKAMRFARGRILDIGSGAGRHSLYLQGKGLEVLGIDNSPLAIKVCKLRGLRNAQVVPINQISSKLGIFDTVIMLGNNFGLFGSYEGAKRLLKKLGGITSEEGRIITSTRDVYKTDDRNHLSYHRLNRKRGRMAGQLRMRVRYEKYATPWFDYLMVSKEELENILDGTGWKVNRYIDHDSSLYMAIIDKVKK